MYGSDALFNIAKGIMASLETPERELSDVLISPFAVGVRSLDFDSFYKIRNGDVNLRAADSELKYVQEGDWFRREDYDGDFDAIPEAQVLLDPRTGYIIKDIEGIDRRVETWRTGSGHQMPWGGGNAIGRMHTLRKQDFSRFGNYDDERVGEYFIRTSEGSEVVLGKGKQIVKVPKVGDHVITIALSGDNFFDFQLLRPDPTADYELRGVLLKPHKGRPEEPFTIGAYHMGQDISPVQVALRME